MDSKTISLIEYDSEGGKISLYKIIYLPEFENHKSFYQFCQEVFGNFVAFVFHGELLRRAPDRRNAEIEVCFVLSNDIPTILEKAILGMRVDESFKLETPPTDDRYRRMSIRIDYRYDRETNVNVC